MVRFILAVSNMVSLGSLHVVAYDLVILWAANQWAGTHFRGHVFGTMIIPSGTTEIKILFLILLADVYYVKISVTAHSWLAFSSTPSSSGYMVPQSSGMLEQSLSDSQIAHYKSWLYVLNLLHRSSCVPEDAKVADLSFKSHGLFRWCFLWS